MESEQTQISSCSDKKQKNTLKKIYPQNKPPFLDKAKFQEIDIAFEIHSGQK